MPQLAIIGGSGLSDYDDLKDIQSQNIKTPYGEHSLPLLSGSLDEIPCAFLPRHGLTHRLPPHAINYRANIWALKELGVKRILAFNVVGGIHRDMHPGRWVIPHQIIDYSYGREHSFSDGYCDEPLRHIDFTHPYTEHLRTNLFKCLTRHNVNCLSDAVYGCTQGPRLETAAEIKKLAQDGCDLVGMTTMPEAALAKELEIEYVSLCLVVNWAAGIGKEELSFDEIYSQITRDMASIKLLLPKLAKSLC